MDVPLSEKSKSVLMAVPFEENRQNRTMRFWHRSCNVEAKQERAMQRDILIISGGFLAVGLALWAFWGNPPMSADSRLPMAQTLDQDRDIRLVTERSPYMRTER
jgi:hypothetical protein